MYIRGNYKRGTMIFSYGYYNNPYMNAFAFNRGFINGFCSAFLANTGYSSQYNYYDCFCNSNYCQRPKYYYDYPQYSLFYNYRYNTYSSSYRYSNDYNFYTVKNKKQTIPIKSTKRVDNKTKTKNYNDKDSIISLI